MMPCPDVDELVTRPPSDAVSLHCRECEACDAIAALAELRDLAGPADEACVQAEIAIGAAAAAPSEIGLTPGHLEQCASCSETAVRVQAFGPIVAEATELTELPGKRAWRPSSHALLAAGVALTSAGMALAAVSLFGSSESEAVLDPAPDSRSDQRSSASAEEPLRSFEAPAGGVVIDAKPKSPTKGPAWISISCSPNCDDVVIDDKNLGPAPIMRHQVQSGSHLILLRSGTVLKHVRLGLMPGVHDVRKINMKDDDEPLSLHPPAPPRPSTSMQPGYLTVVCDPICEQIYVSGKNVGSSPLVRVSLAPGSYSLVLRGGGITKRIAVTIKSGQTTARRVKMSAP